MKGGADQKLSKRVAYHIIAGRLRIGLDGNMNVECAQKNSVQVDCDDFGSKRWTRSAFPGFV